MIMSPVTEPLATTDFVYPETDQQMDFDSELPPVMAALIAMWEDYARNLAVK